MKWFDWFSKKEEVVKAEVKTEKKVEKKKNVEKTKDSTKSTITFEIDTVDDDISVKVMSNYNEDIINTLIDKDYLRADESENEYVIHLAFILIANETSEMIIEGVNNNED